MAGAAAGYRTYCTLAHICFQTSSSARERLMRNARVYRPYCWQASRLSCWAIYRRAATARRSRLSGSLLMQVLLFCLVFFSCCLFRRRLSRHMDNTLRLLPVPVLVPSSSIRAHSMTCPAYRTVRQYGLHVVRGGDATGHHKYDSVCTK